ncbi:MAG: hypothetical protein ACE5FL_15080 [Myxococcota bacterium]
MRSFEVFASMSPEQATEVMRSLKKEAPGMYAQALAAAAAAFRARPVYLARQPIDKQAASIRRALARVAASPIAEELLAVYFLECRRDLLIEWLDALGIAHDEGTLEDDAPAPPPKTKLAKTTRAFRAVDDDADRDLLLAAFAAQESVDWPDLDELIGPSA